VTPRPEDMELAPPQSEADWQAFHDIREAVLFVGRGRTVAYDRNHPDDFRPENEPLLLKTYGLALGTMRLDNQGDGTAVVRLVAIAADQQGRGHGRRMAELCDARARSIGIHTLYVNAAPEAVGFYERLGWERHVWSGDELTGTATDCIQMQKRL
jgi:N-acetylglutamate synthase-like GNAT family acetyltransferase